MIYHITYHIVEEKYGNLFDKCDNWPDDLAELFNFLDPNFKFKTPIFEDFGIALNIQGDIVKELNNFFGK